MTKLYPTIDDWREEPSNIEWLASNISSGPLHNAMIMADELTRMMAANQENAEAGPFLAGALAYRNAIISLGSAPEVEDVADNIKPL